MCSFIVSTPFGTSIARPAQDRKQPSSFRAAHGAKPNEIVAQDDLRVRSDTLQRAKR